MVGSLFGRERWWHKPVVFALDNWKWAAMVAAFAAGVLTHQSCSN